jgi:hypothetical protein
MGEDCRQVVLAHLSQKNNHPELALLEAEEALRRRGRCGVSVTVAAAEGAGWVTIRARGERRREAGQLRLF